MKNYKKDLPVQVVKEWDDVEGQFDPSFLLATVEFVRIHYRGWIVQTWTGHHRSIEIPEQTTSGLHIFVNWTINFTKTILKIKLFK